MNKSRLSLLVAATLAGGLVLTGCKKDAPPAPAPVETAPAPAPAPTLEPAAPAAAAVSITAVTLGKDAAVTAPSTTFAPTDATIHAAVATQTADPAAAVTGKLAAKWSHVDSGQVVAEESKDFSFTGPGTTTFQINKPDGWPTGKYKLEVSLDGQLANTTEFEVK